VGKTFKDKAKWQQKNTKREETDEARRERLFNEKHLAKKQLNRHWQHHRKGEDLDTE
jgi:hypothetical protein